MALGAVESVKCPFSGPLPVVEELFETIDLVYEFVVVTGREWGVWVSGVSDEVGGVNMEGKALGEKFSQDGKLISGGLI